MDKLLKILCIIMGVVFVSSILVGFIGWLANSETLFYTAIAASVFLLPALFVVYVVIFLIATIIDEKNKQ